MLLFMQSISFTLSHCADVHDVFIYVTIYFIIGSHKLSNCHGLFRKAQQQFCSVIRPVSGLPFLDSTHLEGVAEDALWQSEGEVVITTEHLPALSPKALGVDHPGSQFPCQNVVPVKNKQSSFPFHQVTSLLNTQFCNFNNLFSLFVSFQLLMKLNHCS